jgi:hypothetical protein
MKVYMVMVESADRDWGGIDYINSQTICVGVYDSMEAAERTEAEFRVVLDKVRESANWLKRGFLSRRKNSTRRRVLRVGSVMSLEKKLLMSL